MRTPCRDYICYLYFDCQRGGAARQVSQAIQVRSFCWQASATQWLRRRRPAAAAVSRPENSAPRRGPATVTYTAADAHDDAEEYTEADKATVSY